MPLTSDHEDFLMYCLGDILKIIYLGFKKSQRSVTYDFMRYVNILTYLLTYLLSALSLKR